jgi:hypothetical protein
VLVTGIWLFQQLVQRRAVFRLAGHQAEQEDRVFGGGDHLRDLLDGLVRRRAHLRALLAGRIAPWVG